jgi:TetR/AcrR family transcriptional repressor of nem operon
VIVKPKTGDSQLLRVGARERVLEAARTLMEEKGFKNASLNDILAAAGVSSSNFYYHWKSKEDLGLEMVKKFTEGLEEHVIKNILLDRARSPIGRLRGYLDFHREKLESHGCTRGCPFGKLASELSEEDPRFRELLESVFAKVKEALRECIREGIEKGELRRGIDPGSASTLVLGTVQGLMLVAKGDGTIGAFQAGAGELVRLLSEHAKA